jgi:hypothetical protein
VDADVVPIHGGVIVSEGAGDEVLRGEDVGAHTPVPVGETAWARALATCAYTLGNDD